MKGTISNKSSYITKRGYYITADYDECLGGKFRFLLEPLYGSSEERFFYVQKLDNGKYEVTGEGYIITSNDSLQRHLRTLRSSLSGADLWYYHINEAGDIVRREKADAEGCPI